eukprot:c15019_g1_i1.p1 GENE.c15019_g1_i1~~c15019_g1_i1.p1  ORF type:complete len:323 (+),score=58.28 c15019_g1_i1:1073-2041(+)
MQYFENREFTTDSDASDAGDPGDSARGGEDSTSYYDIYDASEHGTNEDEDEEDDHTHHHDHRATKRRRLSAERNKRRIREACAMLSDFVRHLPHILAGMNWPSTSPPPCTSPVSAQPATPVPAPTPEANESSESQSQSPAPSLTLGTLSLLAHDVWSRHLRLHRAQNKASDFQWRLLTRYLVRCWESMGGIVIGTELLDLHVWTARLPTSLSTKSSPPFHEDVDELCECAKGGNNESYWEFNCVCGEHKGVTSKYPASHHPIGDMFECVCCGVWGHVHCYPRYRYLRIIPGFVTCHVCFPFVDTSVSARVCSLMYDKGAAQE